MTLRYKLVFLDYWHLSSGLSAGAKLDSSVVKDEDSLPYAPGKTIKGLVREMLEVIHDDVTFLHQFYFNNATLDRTIKDEIISNKLQNNLYDVIAATQIKDEIAVDDSLREIEVVVPLILEGDILDVTKKDFQRLSQSLKMIKRMGLNRNRGLGRCQFEVEEVK